MRKVSTLQEPQPADPAALAERVRPVCERFGVVLLYVHGRYADPGPLSDLDLAALVPDLPPSERLAFLDALIQATGRDDVDLSYLGEASDLLRFRVANGGRLLYARSEADRVAFVTRARRAWFDSAPKRRERTRLQRRRIEEGSFGRR